MKKVFRFVGIGALFTVFLAVAATTGRAQNPCEDFDGIGALDEKIRTNFAKIETLKVAVEASKQYLEKYGSCEVTKDFSEWVKGQMPGWEKRVRDYDEFVWLKARFDRFDTSIKSQKYEDAFAAAKDIFTKQPDNLNLMVPLGVIGLWESYKENYKFNDESIGYAKQAIAKLKAGAKGTKTNPAGEDVFGVFQFEMTKADALSELNFSVGYINFWIKKDKKTGLPYYYEVSQTPGKYQKDPRVYQTIGSFYFEEAGRLGTEIAKLIEDQKSTEPTDSEEVKATKETAVKARIALFNGYAERAMDAFGRAYRNAPSVTPAEKTYRENIYSTLQNLYERRFEKKDGLDGWISSAVSKPMPNPMSEVTPVSDPDPDTNTTTTTTTSTGNQATGGNTKPVSSVDASRESAVTPKTAEVKADAAVPATRPRTVAKRNASRRRGTR